jgi:general secretion pathway protein G
MKLVLLALIFCATSCTRVDGDRGGMGATVQIATFKTALDAFHEDCGRFPSTAEGLAPLTTRPADTSETKWRGPYLGAAIPKDPWGHDYVYRCPGKHNTNSFDLYSLGPDGVSKSGGDDADDIANWPQRRAHE